MIQLSWPFNFLHTSHVCHILASHHSRVSREIQLRVATWCTQLINYSLSHTHPLLPACFTRVPHSGESLLASLLRALVVSHFLLHTLDQIFTLSHIEPLHYSHLNTKGVHNSVGSVFFQICYRTEPIRIDFLIIKTDAFRLGLVFWPITVWFD